MSLSGTDPSVSVAPRPTRCPQVGEPRGYLDAREKLEKHGERSLSNTELLALARGTGSRVENAMRLAENLLRKYGFEALSHLSLSEWQSNRGIGLVRACRLRAIFEFGRRAFSPKDDERPAL